MAASTDFRNKSFGHCKVKWQIDNFFLQTFERQDWKIESPEFTINGFEETKWCMNLKSEMDDDGNFILFTLRRSDIDSGPKYICFDIRVHCTNFLKSFVCSNGKIKNGSRLEMYLGPMEYLVETDWLNDSLIIICDMIIYSKTVEKKYEECHHEGLKLLSKNMFELYRSAWNFDTKLIFRDNFILAHKSILYVRNTYLRYLLENDYVNFQESLGCRYIRLNDRLNYKGMVKILAYLYTGNMRHVLEEASFDIYDCASFLGISEIEAHYAPDELFIKSSVDFEEYSCILSGYKFENNSLVWNFDGEKEEKTYQLRFYPKKELNGDCIQLFNKTFKKPIWTCFQLKFFDKNNYICTISLITLKDGFVDFDEMIGSIAKILHSSLTSFDIVMKFKITTNIKISRIHKQSTAFVSYINDDFYYDRLSENMNFLVDEFLFSDMRIMNSNTFFFVHKCILASRSPYFLNLFMRNEDVILPDIEPGIMHAVLSYIYTGIPTISFEGDFIDVYEAAVYFHLPQLKSICSQGLMSCFKTDKDIRCRVVRIAEEYKDDPLMKFVLHHLFYKQDILIPRNNLLSFRDVYICRHCL